MTDPRLQEYPDPAFRAYDMGTHILAVAGMKTTLDISDPLFKEAKAVAKREATTIRALVERGLRLALEERKAGKPFKLRNAAVGGHGLQPEASNLTWEQIRARSYEGRGE